MHISRISACKPNQTVTTLLSELKNVKKRMDVCIWSLLKRTKTTFAFGPVSYNLMTLCFCLSFLLVLFYYSDNLSPKFPSCAKKRKQFLQSMHHLTCKCVQINGVLATLLTPSEKKTGFTKVVVRDHCVSCSPGCFFVTNLDILSQNMIF